MSRIKVQVDVTVYVTDEGDWGASTDRLGVETRWNDDRGEFATLVIGGHRYTVAARDLRAALNAVTTRS